MGCIILINIDKYANQIINIIKLYVYVYAQLLYHFNSSITQTVKYTVVFLKKYVSEALTSFVLQK